MRHVEFLGSRPVKMCEECVPGEVFVELIIGRTRYYCNSWPQCESFRATIITPRHYKTVISRPTYDEFVKDFSWDTLLAHFDWPATEKFNMAHELCDRWANDPDKADQVALYFETKDGARGTYTFRQLRDLSNRFANVLAELGVKRVDLVGGLFPKLPSILPALLGIWKLGAVYVPLFTAFAAPAVAYRLRQSETSVVITDEANLRKVHQSRQSAEALPLIKYTLVEADQGNAFEPGERNVWGALKAASNESFVAQLTLD